MQGAAREQDFLPFDEDLSLGRSLRGRLASSCLAVIWGAREVQPCLIKTDARVVVLTWGNPAFHRLRGADHLSTPLHTLQGNFGRSWATSG